jgi:riboflavin synthase
MFSGIIEKRGTVHSVEEEDGTVIIEVATGFEGLELGESIAVNGVCLTVVKFNAKHLATFFVSRETIARSNLGHLAPLSSVNLERSVKLETRLSGHLVQGHVDGLATLESITPDAEAFKLVFAMSPVLGKYCVEKGSIALNGISLTLNSVETDPAQTRIGLTIIPHTWAETNLSDLSEGDEVNVEVDVIAKYVERLCQPYLQR